MNGERFPLVDRDVVFISSIDWDFLWQGHQEIALRFARAGNRVVFVENTGIRTVRASDWRRLAHRLVRSMRTGRRGSTTEVRVVAPLLVPFPRSWLARALNERILIPRLARRIRRMVGTDPILFTYLPTRNALRLIHDLRGPRSRVVYYCIADFHQKSDLGATLERSEAELVRSADLVFVQSQRFAERFRQWSERLHVFQFGVNLEVFSGPARRSVPTDLAGLPRPLIGYSGGLHAQVDLALLSSVARDIGGTLVLVGALQVDPGPLRDQRNIVILGLRPFSELPDIIAAFDVALIPYVRDAYGETVFPTKLFEYLAAGRPVVSTDLPEVRKLQLPDWAIRLVSSDVEFVSAVRAALVDETPSDPARRRALAEERDWRVIVRQMARLIAGLDA